MPIGFTRNCTYFQSMKLRLISVGKPNESYVSEGIEQRANESCKQLVFLIGGAFGVEHAVTQRAQAVWSLSALVFPHMLVRLILAEQVYRACTIIKNEKYHHI